MENIQIQLENGSYFNTAMTERLKTPGEEGWELAGVNGTMFYFKRDIT